MYMLYTSSYFSLWSQNAAWENTKHLIIEIILTKISELCSYSYIKLVKNLKS